MVSALLWTYGNVKAPSKATSNHVRKISDNPVANGFIYHVNGYVGDAWSVMWIIPKAREYTIWYTTLFCKTGKGLLNHFDTAPANLKATPLSPNPNLEVGFHTFEILDGGHSPNLRYHIQNPGTFSLWPCNIQAQQRLSSGICSSTRGRLQWICRE